MKYRKLRIAWSVLCGMAVLLLIALWVRSYQFQDEVYVGYVGPSAGQTGVNVILLVSLRGRLIVQPRNAVPWRFQSYKATDFSNWFPDSAGLSPTLLSPQIFRWTKSPFIECHIPFWCLIVTIAVVGVIPWIRQLNWSFSLRTLLIATTLAAILLGLIVWAMHG